MLLLDQNLSPKLAKALQPSFPGCEQVRRLGLEDAEDIAIWRFAKREGFAILTSDRDFHDLALLHGHPPKVILLRFGNTSTEQLQLRLTEQAFTIHQFLRPHNVFSLLVLQ